MRRGAAELIKESRRRERGRLRFPLPVEKHRNTERHREFRTETPSSSSSAEMILTGLVFLVLTAAVSPGKSQEIKEITGNSVILTCTGGTDDKITWKKKGKEVWSGQTKQDVTVTAADQGTVEGEFICEYEDVSQKKVEHMFYLNVKVCENCYELTGLMAAAVMFADLLITGGVILIVYICVPKNTGSTQQKASKPRAASAPPVPNPDYERLNQHARTSDLYSALK